jgi:hypothetical protein
MKGVYIVNRLKEILPKYTDDFSTILNVSTLTRSGTTITCTSATAHGLSNNDYVTIRGAKKPIALSSITFLNGIATATASTDHELSDPSLYSPANLPLYVEIAGASGYNGVKELVSVPTNLTFTFKVSGSPSTVAGGFLLAEDEDGYNGYKQITLINSTSFSYQTTGTMQSPAQGTIQVSCLTRIDHAPTPARIQQYYSTNSSNVSQVWAYVVLSQNQSFKDDTIVGDSASSNKKNESYWNLSMQQFNIYVVIPSADSTLGGNKQDQAKTYLKPLLKCLANYIFVSDLVEKETQPCQFIGDDADDYIEARYTHRFDFAVPSIIQTFDTADFSNGTPLKIIDGTFSGNNLEFYVNTRN